MTISNQTYKIDKSRTRNILLYQYVTVHIMIVMTNHDHSLTEIVDLTQDRATFWSEMINNERTVAVKAMPEMRADLPSQ